MRKAIPRAWIDLKPREVLTIVFQLLKVGKAAGSDRVHEFEKDFAEYIGTKHAVAFSSCRAGMYFGLKAMDWEDGDEVLLPAFTYFADAAMVTLAGLVPVFVDVDFDTAAIKPGDIENKITSRTKAIFLTHLNGIAADMGSIMDIAARHKLRVFEDCARACGLQYKDQKLGSFDIGTYSFSYGKNFYLFGGGMVTSDDDAFIERLRKIKTEFHSKSKKQTLLETIKGCVLKFVNTPLVFTLSLFPLVYENKVRPKQRFKRLFPRKMPIYEKVPSHFYLNMNNVQAEQGLRFLERIEDHNTKRSENARSLRKELENLKAVHLFQSSQFQNEDMLYFAIQSKNKDELQRYLVRKKIDAEHESARNLPQLDQFKQFGAGEYPNAAALENTIILLPSHPNLTKKEIKYMSDKIREYS